MKIILANPRGFCAGVYMAIDVVDQLLDVVEGDTIYVYHAIVHNKHVVQRFEDALRQIASLKKQNYELKEVIRCNEIKVRPASRIACNLIVHMICLIFFRHRPCGSSTMPTAKLRRRRRL